MTSVKTIKENAKKILNTDLITHIGALLLPAVCSISFMLTGTMLSTFAGKLAGDAVYGISVYVFLIFTIAMTIPLIYGYAVFEANCVKTGNAVFSDMFCAFSCAELYFRSFKVFYSLLWRFAFVFAAPIALMQRFIMYTKHGGISKLSVYGYDITYTILVLMVIIAFTASSAVYCRFIPALYIAVTREDRPVSECFFAAKIYLKNCNARLYKLAISFIPTVLLGIFSLGIMFIYVLPLIITAFFMFAHERYEDESLNIDTINMIFN